jgi:hypothetical protein
MPARMTEVEIRALRDLAGKACVHFKPFEPDFPTQTSERLFIDIFKL